MDYFRALAARARRASCSHAPAWEQVLTRKPPRGASGRWSGQTAFPRWSVGTRRCDTPVHVLILLSYLKVHPELW